MTVMLAAAIAAPTYLPATASRTEMRAVADARTANPYPTPCDETCPRYKLREQMLQHVLDQMPAVPKVKR